MIMSETVLQPRIGHPWSATWSGPGGRTTWPTPRFARHESTAWRNGSSLTTSSG